MSTQAQAGGLSTEAQVSQHSWEDGLGTGGLG